MQEYSLEPIPSYTGTLLTKLPRELRKELREYHTYCDIDVYIVHHHAYNSLVFEGIASLPLINIEPGAIRRFLSSIKQGKGDRLRFGHGYTMAHQWGQLTILRLSEQGIPIESLPIPLCTRVIAGLLDAERFA